MITTPVFVIVPYLQSSPQLLLEHVFLIHGIAETFSGIMKKIFARMFEKAQTVVQVFHMRALSWFGFVGGKANGGACSKL